MLIAWVHRLLDFSQWFRGKIAKGYRWWEVSYLTLSQISRAGKIYGRCRFMGKRKCWTVGRSKRRKKEVTQGNVTYFTCRNLTWSASRRQSRFSLEVTQPRTSRHCSASAVQVGVLAPCMRDVYCFVEYFDIAIPRLLLLFSPSTSNHSNFLQRLTRQPAWRRIAALN